MKLRFLYTALFLLLLTSACLYGQSPGNFSIEKGFDKYPLGSKEPEADSLLAKPVGSDFQWKGIKYVTYFYKNANEHPYKLADVDFKILILNYGDSTLGNIEFTKIYSSRLYPDYENRAKDEFKKLYAFYKEKWKGGGKKETAVKVGDKIVRFKHYEWNSGNRVMKLWLDWTKRPGNSYYSISLSLEAKADL
ncbi:MAG: hypothetical protein IPH18_11465 [Chitinophagaceae bacterium]|nr:hypothetical protein [Chitinophagaceae bacterium]